jgi:hypothetical protein
MKRSRLGLQLLLVFAATLIGYAAVYGWIEHRRVIKGPWVVTFASASGVPVLTVNQTTLGITNLQIVFAHGRAPTNATQTVDFSQARPWPYVVPFGQCVFMDTTFLPGTIALELFGHEIQLLPRVLTIDKAERPWRSGERIELK